jgi:predicted alpha/beta-hydrolase family hydrolase
MLSKLTINISDEIGNVSGLLLMPNTPIALMVLSHGAGAGMEHPFMQTLAEQLADQHIGTLRFNFAYMEKGKKAPDRPKKAHPVILAAVDKASSLAKGLPLLVGGKSFGGRMSSQLVSASRLPRVKGIVYYGFPLHAPGKPGTERAAHLADIKIPQLFLQGTRDNLAKLDLIREVCAGLDHAQLIIMEGGDHSFKTLKRSGVTHEQAIEQLARHTAIFAGELLG